MAETAPAGPRPDRGPNHVWRQLRLWLEPGIGVKRWLLLMILGTVLIGLGLAYILLDLYRANPDSQLPGGRQPDGAAALGAGLTLCEIP